MYVAVFFCHMDFCLKPKREEDIGTTWGLNIIGWKDYCVTYFRSDGWSNQFWN